MQHAAMEWVGPRITEISQENIYKNFANQLIVKLISKQI